MIVNDLSVWLDNAPFISIGGDWEFSTWIDNAPVIEQDEGGSGITKPNQQIF
jgi:hypothetical protein